VTRSGRPSPIKPLRKRPPAHPDRIVGPGAAVADFARRDTRPVVAGLASQPFDKGLYLGAVLGLGGGGDFAEAYVIAHEVGHHVQTLQGVSAKVNAARRNGENVEGDAGLLVRQELQADC
jgi:hypothetical protein